VEGLQPHAPLPTIYRGEGEGAAALGGWLAPHARGAPPLGFPTNPRRMGQGVAPSPPGAGAPPFAAHVALQGWMVPLVDPRNTTVPPGTLPVDPRTFPESRI
jgi:hypothetical protein